MSSRALTEFQKTLSLAQSLIDLEATGPDPPPPQEQVMSQALRGGAAVLMVAAFERFVRDAVVEHVAPFTTQPPRVPFSRLPEKMQVASIFNSLSLSMNGPRYGQTKRQRIERMADIKRACALVVAEIVDPVALSYTNGNPGPETVTQICSNLGLSDFFRRARDEFEQRWGRPEAETFLRDKLDEIVQRRHIVAHSANALAITRSQLQEAVRFLGILAEVLDQMLARRVADILESASTAAESTKLCSRGVGNTICSTSRLPPQRLPVKQRGPDR